MIRLRSLLPLSSLLTIGLTLCSTVHAQQAWIPPTPEELQMTSIKEVPGADAVILNRDELDDDDNHKESIYSRIKILTERGVHLGDVELPYDKRSDQNGNSIDNIEGRTIQPDGTIIPFTGKPYDKVPLPMEAYRQGTAWRAARRPRKLQRASCVGQVAARGNRSQGRPLADRTTQDGSGRGRRNALPE